MTAALEIGGTITLSTVSHDSLGQVLTPTLTWRSSQATVATVDGSGKVTAVGEGTTNLTATSGTIVSNASLVTVTLSATTTAVATPIGTATGVAVSQSIGPAGGSLPSADGRLTLIVPAGAVASATTFTIQPVTNQAPGGIGDAYQLLPDGLTFTTPVQLAFHYTSAEMAGIPSDALTAGYQDAQRYWRTIFAGTYDTVSTTLTVPTTHFTVFSSFAGFQLLPGEKTIPVGSTLGLTAVDCSPVSANDPRRNACTTGHFTVNTWAVNSTPGGTSNYGTVVGGSLGATYTAPTQQPPFNPVSVTANVDAGLRSGGRGSLLVVSNITVYADSWTGIADDDGNPLVGSHAQIKWVLESRINDVATYRPTGTATVHVIGCTVSPASAAINPTTGVLVVDFNQTPVTFHGQAYTMWSAHTNCGPPPGPPDPGFALARFFNNGDAEATGFVSVTSGSATIVGTNSYTTWFFTRDH